VIARLCGLAVDARAATRTRDPVELAIATRWIAANLLSIRGARLVIEGMVPAGGRLFGARVASLGDLLAALAAVPALVDAATLPRHWRLGLRALGIPMLDRPVPAALAAGASVVALAPTAGSSVDVVVAGDGGYRVRVADAQCRRAA